MPQPVQIPSAERQRAKVLVNAAQQRLCARHPQRACSTGVAGVVADLEIIAHVALASRAERLNGKRLALFHLGVVGALDDRDRLCAVDAVLANIVTSQVTDSLDGVRGAIDLAFVRLHDFLDRGANVGDAHVDACLADASVGGVFDCVD